MSSSLFNAMMQNNGNRVVNNMLNNLKMQNPTAYNQLNALIQNGNTDETIHRLIGQLNPQQLSEFRSISNMLGLDISKYIK